MEYIYFSTLDNNLIDNYDIVKAAKLIYGKDIFVDDYDAIREFAKNCKGIKREIKNPSVKYLIKHGYKTRAVQIYYRKFEGGIRLSEAKAIIDKMEKEMNDQNI